MLHAFVGTPRKLHKFQAPFIANCWCIMFGFSFVSLYCYSRTFVSCQRPGKQVYCGPGATQKYHCFYGCNLKFISDMKYLLCLYPYMSAKHQENDTPVKANHLLLPDCGVPRFWFQNTVCWGAPRAREGVENRSHKSSVEWWPFVTYPAPRVAPPLKGTGSKGKGSIQVFPSHDSATGCRREGPTCSRSRTHPSPKRSQVGVHVVLPQGSIASFQNFWNQSQFMKIRREVHSQSRIKALRIRMRQFISPLIVISTWVGRSQHVPSLVKLVDELHEDHCRRHLPGSIVENGIDIALIVTH